jgi:hypothetical protein
MIKTINKKLKKYSKNLKGGEHKNVRIRRL